MPLERCGCLVSYGKSFTPKKLIFLELWSKNQTKVILIFCRKMVWWFSSAKLSNLTILPSNYSPYFPKSISFIIPTFHLILKQYISYQIPIKSTQISIKFTNYTLTSISNQHVLFLIYLLMVGSLQSSTYTVPIFSPIVPPLSLEDPSILP